MCFRMKQNSTVNDEDCYPKPDGFWFAKNNNPSMFAIPSHPNLQPQSFQLSNYSCKLNTCNQ